MSYRIMYSPEDRKRYPQKAEKKPPYIWITVGLIIIILTLSNRTAVGKAAQRWLIPGEAEITKEAFSTMVEEIRLGVGVDKAVTTFCREIIEYAAVQSSAGY